MRDFARHEMLWSLQVPRYFFVIRCPQFLVPDSKGVELSTKLMPGTTRLVLSKNFCQTNPTRAWVLSLRSETIRAKSCSSFPLRARTCTSAIYDIASALLLDFSGSILVIHCVEGVP
jgi:hypothetical protein